MPWSSSFINLKKSPTVCDIGFKTNSHVSWREGKGTENTGKPSLYCKLASRKEKKKDKH